MRFEEVGIAGAYVLTPERRSDERGYFARIHCTQELADHNLDGEICQINTGFNPKAGTLRGMHYQLAPHGEVKIIHCVRGAVFDVIIDLRPSSPTYKRWYGVELDATSGRMLYAPEGTAHGYLTLVNDCELLYTTNKSYAPTAARGLHHSDPAFGIQWPNPVHLVSPADAAWPAFIG
jgi:dTDP-4-dehydrorhamnose 3,5-epimerase